ncbi:hypothetical protein [Mucilaginibacter terrae]|uniref:DUF2750 domain-containing protein n=1 Tax=Mucilaginibacter terrae TaxID=1955052 RepID=A0ABU3H1B7_9SPHI|nr:hypothetical protein [Mucilaginibacter terrae]MDT3404720.1 hypothetical protein [Mucilaginibacter terrae]
MIRNITQDIRNAIATEVLWGLNDIYEFAEVAELFNFKITYWDEGENWAYIEYNDVSLGYIWRKHPLMFLSASHKNELKKLLTEFNYVIDIFVDDFGGEDLIIDFDQQIMERLSGELPYDVPVSVSDIWSYSVTW